MPTIDHLLWGAPDLDQGIAEIEGLIGVRAVKSGRHPGYGTWNALASLGSGVYLEVIAPDPEQKGADSPRLRQINSLPKPGLMTFAMRDHDLAATAARARAAGLDTGGIIDRSRTTPAGDTVRWRSLFLDGHDFGRWLPFGIDWMDTPHPAGHTPKGATLLSFHLIHPLAGRLNTTNHRLGFDLPTIATGPASFRATIAGTRGIVELQG